MMILTALRMKTQAYCPATLPGPSRSLVLWLRSSLKRVPRPGQVPVCPFSPVRQAGWASVTCGSSQDRHLLLRVPAPPCLSLAAPRERCVDRGASCAHRSPGSVPVRMPRADLHTPVLGTQELPMGVTPGYCRALKRSCK